MIKLIQAIPYHSLIITHIKDWASGTRNTVRPRVVKREKTLKYKENLGKMVQPKLEIVDK